MAALTAGLTARAALSNLHGAGWPPLAAAFVSLSGEGGHEEEGGEEEEKREERNKEN